MQHTSQALDGCIEGNPSVSSLVSSSNSSTVSSILPHGHTSGSSQSDVASEHISYPSHDYSLEPLRGPYHGHSMGQSYSTDPSPPPPLAKTSTFQAAVVTGSKLKRAFGARRKKSETIANPPLFSNPLKHRHADSRSPSPSTLSQQSSAPSISSSSRSALGSKLHLPSNVFSRKFSKSSAVLEPPIPPPKASPKSSMDKPLPVLVYSPDNSHNSIIPVTPGMVSALDYMRRSDEEQRAAHPMPLPEPPIADFEKSEPTISSVQKDLWRKSDSTMSHHTVRPTVGNRTPRPVSMAESLQSNHTIVPMNKRISALITDAEFATPEETEVAEDQATVPSPRRMLSSSSLSSLKAKKRYSSSLTFGAKLSATQSHTQPLATREWKPSVPEVPRISPTAFQQPSSLTRTDANGIISPSSAGPQSTGSNIRGRLAAWTNNTPGSRRVSPQTPQTSQSSPDTQYPSFRNTAISITSSFSPAAGLAKRAVERMGKALGGMHTSHTSISSSAPSAYHGGDLGRVSSRQSSVSPGPSKSKRRTPNAPSGAWSISSSTSSSRSTSESDIFSMTTGPVLGICLRGSIESSGVVFGRPLHMGVREAGPVARGEHRPTPEPIASQLELELFERRRLTALAVRCAQHLMVWGVQEEGLFRLNGRPSHISKLRTEFDTGADFELVECGLGDLDPHAVASVFKAYLRELPEPILTRVLSPYFEAAIQTEQNELATIDTALVPSNEFASNGPTLPANPRHGNLPLRKPPSLSTLAMPKFSSMRPPSKKLLNTVATLIHKLPAENRDLLLTVTQLIKATANRSKETRMPLSNLLLVFCPSLNMNPPLLRVLCEGEGIWDGPPVFDIKPDSEVLDIASAQDEDTSDQDDHSIKMPSLIADSTSSSSSFVNVSLSSSSVASIDQSRIKEDSLPCLSTDSLPDQSDVSVNDKPLVEPTAPSLVDEIPPPARRRRPKLDALVQFPTFSGPASPVLTTRKSVTSLSLPSFTFKSSSDRNLHDSSPPVTPSSLRDKRRHRPSLQRLIPRRSSTALNSAIFPHISAPLQASNEVTDDSPATTPISTHAYTLPTIESLPWSVETENGRRQSIISRQGSLSPAPGSTPIADLYQTPAGSMTSLSATKSPSAMQRAESSESDETFCSLSSPSRLDFFDSEEDADWTRSVLLAADLNILDSHH